MFGEQDNEGEGRTLLEVVNRVLFQWFFIRLAWCCDGEGRFHYSLMGFVWPLSGWSDDYDIIGEDLQFWRVTPKFRIKQEEGAEL